MEVGAGVVGDSVPASDISVSEVGVVCIVGCSFICCVSMRGVRMM